MKQPILTKEEIYHHQKRCDEMRLDIRRKLQAAGYGPMTLREAEQVARRLTVRH